MWCWIISPFYDFCIFWYVAVNTVDKLQFLSFIFAVLLSITVHFTALTLGRTIMHQHTKILLKSNLKRRSGGLRYVTISNFFEIGQSVMEMLQFFNKIFAEFYWLKGSRGPRCTIVPNFVNRPIRCEDIAIFCFFKMAAVRHLGFVWGIFRPPMKSLYYCAKFGYDRWVFLIMWMFQYLAGKSLLTLQKLGFEDYLIP